ncbi:hypothetical protein AA0113_g801 [Alternaria arborescens]|uniref:Uncharacterized protein n=1 Tax=Alternaria arborescens TaxID=156630 RepID=A0A4Q4SR82_9PLEO|nr:hypothetical protein AA0111_g11705 [Alternaria arborescens]RYO15398.1 hypothetical protein AA0111_g11705 [Alternaria arborescens]RYO72943.1 hypothetical protein AA0113_g801 [Alternaria arborescens]
MQTRRDIWKALFKKLEADQDRRYTVADPGGDVVIADLIGSAGQAGKLLQPQTAIEDETKLRFSASPSDEDNKLRLNGRNIRNTLLSAISVATKEATTDGRVIKEIKLTIHYVETVLSNGRRLREDFKAATEFYPEELAREGDVRGVEV